MQFSLDIGTLGNSMVMKNFLPVILLVCLSIQVTHAQHVIRGNVVDEQQRPLAAVTVTVNKNKIAVLTDSSGSYSFSFPEPTVILAFTHIGYGSFILHATEGDMPTTVLTRDTLYLPETVVNAFERNSSIKNTPVAVTVLDKDQVQRYGSVSFVPAVNTVPGVKMDERSPGSYRLSIRGNLLRSTFGVRNVKVYWNGIPFTDANGSTYINELALNNIGKMEIIKGPSGSMYGTGTGGVLLLSSDVTPQKGKSITLQTSAGSYGLFNTAATYNNAGKDINSSLSFSHQQADGYRKHTTMRKDVANFTGKYIINEKHDISANIFYSDLYYKTPGGLTQVEMQKDPKQARPAAGAFNSAEAQKAALYLKTLYAGLSNDYRFNGHWSNFSALYISHTNFSNPAIRNYERKTEQGAGFRTVSKYSNDFFTGTFGAEYQYGFSNTSTFGNNLGEIDTLQYHDEIDSRQFNIFLQADFNLAAGMLLNAGISYNNFYYGFRRLNELPSTKVSSDFSPQIIPRVSLLKKLGSNSTVYTSVSKGYSPPSIDEVHAGDGNFNKRLDAETGINYEIGIKTSLARNRLCLDASYYIFRLRNTIVSRRDAAGADYFVNAGKTRQQGFEIASSYLAVNSKIDFIRQLKFWANYTFIHARFINYGQGTVIYDRNKLTGTAPNVCVGGADLETSKGIYTNLTYSYTDEIPLNDANSFYSGHYNLFFVKLGYKARLGKRMDADFYIAYDKSFNAPYSLGNDLNAAGNRFFNPSAPENMYGGIGLKFRL